MFTVFWGIKKFAYELQERGFTLETDHKVLTELKNKDHFHNDSLNKWLKKI